MTKTESTTLVVETKHDKGKRGLAIFDLLLRIVAMVAALAAAAAMGSSDQQLSFSTQFFKFQAEYDDVPTFHFFLIAMAVVAVYLLLSLPFSIVSIVRPHAGGPRLFLLLLDAMALVFNTTAASAAAAIVYLAHNGNANTNWLAICNQFKDFCQKTSGAVVAAYGAALMFVLLIILSGFALPRH